ncbi:MAG: hypothetical protein AAF348_11520 [Bacteroidota bacterium]
MSDKKEFKGTKGEWISDFTLFENLPDSIADWIYIKEGDGKTIAEVKGFHCGISNQECKANAQLILAAPELLEALKDSNSALEYIKSRYGKLDGVGWDRLEKNNRSALNKALGIKE